MPKESIPAKVFEASTVRLSVDETRTLIRAHVSGAPLVSGPSGRLNDLCELGMFSKKKMPPKDTLTSLWADMRRAVGAKNVLMIAEIARKIDNKKYQAENFQYTLTPLGKDLARGISVRLADGQNSMRMAARVGGL